MPTRIASLALGLLCFAGLASAQLTRGFISGTVQDSGGAVIAGAKVTITNEKTGLTANTATNETGFYRFVAVEPGSYSVEFSNQGFRATRVAGVNVSTSSEVTVNQSLEVSSVETVIEVQDTPPGVELAKASATISRTLQQNTLESLPLTAVLRDINTLALTAPTAVRTTLVRSGFSANGQRPSSNNFMVDGVDNNDVSITVQASRTVPESVAEFQIQTNAYSAEFGRSAGGQIQLATRSGTNQFHGSAWDYYTANWLQANSWINKAGGITKNPRLVQNQAGGSIGGPVIRNKTFFFQLVEANRGRAAESASNNPTPAVVPTPEGYRLLQSVPLGPNQSTQKRQAVLKDIDFLPGIYDKYASTIQTLAASNFPVVNGVRIPVGTAFIPIATPNNYWVSTTRVDHELSSKDRLTYRLNFDKRVDSDLVSNQAFSSLFSGDQTLSGYNHMFSHTRTLRSNLINEFRYGYVIRDLFFPERSDRPTVTIGGLMTIGGQTNFPQGRRQDGHQFQEVLTWLKGRHSLKFGADIRYQKFRNDNRTNLKGAWTFNNLEDFMNANPSRLQQALSTSAFEFSAPLQYYFAQDDFKVTKDLTLNFGIRYEFTGAPAGFFGAANDQIAAAGVQRNMRPDRNNFAPRFGFAWSPSGKSGFLGKLLGEGETVIRGGYGLGYDFVFYNLAIFPAGNYPRVVNLDLRPPQDNLDYPNLAPRSDPASALPALNPLQQFINMYTNMKNPVSHFYSMSIQRQFARSYIFELGYSGTRSHSQIRQSEYNPAMLTPAQAQRVIDTNDPLGSIPSANARRINPWGSRIVFEPTANAIYNAGFVRLDKRLSHGLVMGVNYTYSSNIGDHDEPLGVTELATTPNVPQNYFNYRPERSRSVFDRPHRLAVHYTYDIPWFREGVIGSAAMRHVFGGWRLSGFTDVQSGIPFTIRTGVDSVGQGAGGTPSRPDWNPNGILTADPVTGNFRTFTTPRNNTSVFLVPRNRVTGAPLANSMPNGGNLGRNTMRSPYWQNWNMSLAKTISLGERFKVNLRSDWVNAFNYRNFRTPGSNMNSPAFGTQLSDPGYREILMSAKVTF